MVSDMTEVLLSIRPEWCKKIIDGKKNIEVRKTMPKCEIPFKCYIYCTKPTQKNPRALYTAWGFIGLIHRKDYNYIERHENTELLSGKVIGEFVCDAIIPISVFYSNPDCEVAHKEFPFTSLSDKQIIDYLGNGKKGYGWHISDLIIYDKPKDLSEFKKINRDCHYSDLGLAIPKCKQCRHEGCYVTRPPQSWCYVEEA